MKTQPQYIAFTGTQHVTVEQRAHLWEVITTLPRDAYIITGTCIGVDELVARRAHYLGLHVVTIVPFKRSKVDQSWREHCSEFYEMPDSVEPYRARNEEMVKRCTRLIAFPAYEEKHPLSQRSGTWMTIRIAKRAGIVPEIHVLRQSSEETLSFNRFLK